MDFARALWQRIETLHAVTYFGDETVEAGKTLGLPGFWATYFAMRAAPLGPVGPGVVDATFYNFAPSFVRRWVPAIWDDASPEEIVRARSAAAAATLRRVAPDIDDAAEVVAQRLALACEHGSRSGRALYAANRDLAVPTDPVEALWQYCTTIREHRGDAHNAALLAQGIDGLEAHVMIAADGGSSPDDLQKTRGWTVDDWSSATARCRTRGIVEADGSLTEHGRQVRLDVEATTDRLAYVLVETFEERDRDELLDALTPVAIAVSRAGVIRYPNPIGLNAL